MANKIKNKKRTYILRIDGYFVGLYRDYDDVLDKISLISSKKIEIETIIVDKENVEEVKRQAKRLAKEAIDNSFFNKVKAKRKV